MKTKTCTQCNQDKPLEEFGNHKQKSDGKNSWCILCQRIKNREYSAKCKDKKAEYDKEYCKTNKKKIQERGKKYREANKEAKAVYDKAYRESKGEDRLRDKRDYYHNRGGKEVAKQWALDNSDKVKATNSNVKAKRREQIKTSTLTAKDLLDWESTQPKLCTYCGDLCHDTYHIDHVEPLAKGGKHELDNLVIACSSCNQSKNAKQLIHWMATKQTDRSKG